MLTLSSKEHSGGNCPLCRIARAEVQSHGEVGYTRVVS